MKLSTCRKLPSGAIASYSRWVAPRATGTSSCCNGLKNFSVMYLFTAQFSEAGKGQNEVWIQSKAPKQPIKCVGNVLCTVRFWANGLVNQSNASRLLCGLSVLAAKAVQSVWGGGVPSAGQCTGGGTAGSAKVTRQGGGFVVECSPVGQPKTSQCGNIPRTPCA